MPIVLVGITVTNEIGVCVALRDGKRLRLRQCNGLLDCGNSSESSKVFPEAVSCHFLGSGPFSCDVRHDNDGMAAGLQPRLG
jgi:hypothetical protein